MTCPWQHITQGIRLRIHLQPRAASNRVVGLHGESLKIALTAPPVEGAANTALLRFLAFQLKIPISSLSLLSGEKSREKQVLIYTTHSEQITQSLMEMLRRVDKKNRDD